MTTLTKIERFFKEITLTADDQLFVGVDVHKKSYHVALYLNDAPSLDFVMPANNTQLSQLLKPAQPALRQVVYETGFSGYGLARCLTKDHLPVSVAATSKIPRPSATGDKTDKLDSKKLAEYAAKGLLKPVAIPTLKQEADRQLYRMRHRQSRNLAKVKVQIKSFLQMHHIAVSVQSWPVSLRPKCSIIVSSTIRVRSLSTSDWLLAFIRAASIPSEDRSTRCRTRGSAAI